MAHVFVHGPLQGGVVWSPLRALRSVAAPLVGSWHEDCTLELPQWGQHATFPAGDMVREGACLGTSLDFSSGTQTF